MTARRIACLVVLALGFASAHARAEVVKVILLGGQSNMVGKGLTAELPEKLRSPQEDVRFFWGDGRNTPKDPLKLSELTTLRPGAGGTPREFGPEVTFGRTVADARPGEKFALIKYAVEGTNLRANWRPNAGNNLHKAFRDTVEAGLAALKAQGHEVRIVGMLWYQGGADAKMGRTTAEYEADLKAFIADMRSRYGKDMPFFVGRLSTGSPLPRERLFNIRTAQENVARTVPGAYLVSSDELSHGKNEHIDAAGQMLLGERFAEAFLAATRETAASKPASEE